MPLKKKSLPPQKKKEQAIQYQEKMDLHLTSRKFYEKRAWKGHENAFEDCYEKKRAVNRSHYFKISKYI